MVWIIATALLLMYLLGLFVFHATGPIHILPFVALAISVIDHWLVRRYRTGGS